jgi:polyferredoxin
MVVFQTARSATLVFQNVDPYYALFNLFGEVSLTAVLALAAVVILSLFIERPFCKYACPYGALMGLTNFLRIFGIRRKASGCVQCKACDRACPMNIDVSASGTVRDVRCVSCLKCASSEGACPIPDTVTMNMKEEK